MNTLTFDKNAPVRVEKEKAGIYVSIIVPTHRTSPDRRVDLPEVKKAIEKAKKELQDTYSAIDTEPIMRSIDDLFDKIDFVRNPEGIGLFVSDQLKELVPFYFPVKEKILISHSFDLRDRFYQQYYAQSYMVLLLTEKEVKLYRGSLDNLEEIKNGSFPISFKDDYEYSRPSRGNSYVGEAATQGFEKDKTHMETIRYEHFLKTVDATLRHVNAGKLPLLISGSKRTVSLYKKISELDVAGEIHGNYWYSPLNEFGLLCRNTIQTFYDNRTQHKISLFKEKIGEGHGISSLTGLNEIWKAVREGRGLQLLVERDFSVPGYFIKGDENNLYLYPRTEAQDTVPDIVNRIMEIVLEKGGTILVVENDALAGYGHMGLLTRY